MILYHSADLIWATRIKSVSEAVGTPARPVRTLAMLEERLRDSTVRAVLVDLDAPEIALVLINRLRGPNATPTERSIRIVAYGPHIALGLFEDARKAGADHVLARGAFGRHLPDWLAALAADPRQQNAATGKLPVTE